MSEVTIHHFSHGIEIKDAQTDADAWKRAKTQAKKDGIDPESLRQIGATTYIALDLYRNRKDG